MKLRNRGVLRTPLILDIYQNSLLYLESLYRIEDYFDK